MSKIIIDKQVLENWIKYIDTFPLYPEDRIKLKSILQQSEEEHSKKLIVTSYTQKGKEKIIHEDVISDEYWTEHKNVDGSILKVKVKAL